MATTTARTSSSRPTRSSKATARYVTRINLDVTDPAHRITLLTPVGSDGLTHLNALDGSTWDPFTHTLLATQENDNAAAPIQLSMDWPAKRTTLEAIGRGGYEGIHPDDQGNLILAEDVGGTEVSVDPSDPSAPEVAKQPNSFIYRFVPKNRSDLTKGGKLQALQVMIHGHAVRFHAANPSGDVFSQDRLALHTLGTSWPAHWITIHNTATNGTAPFDANALAKAAGATPFERPENLQFRPGSGFHTFVFAATGDTNADAGSVPALAKRGSWGSLFTVQHRRTAARATSRSWRSAMRHTPRSTTWRLPTATRCSPPRIAGTACTRSSTRSTRCGHTT